jgi:hypothetical protein
MAYLTWTPWVWFSVVPSDFRITELLEIEILHTGTLFSKEPFILYTKPYVSVIRLLWLYSVFDFFVLWLPYWAEASCMRFLHHTHSATPQSVGLLCTGDRLVFYLHSINDACCQHVDPFEPPRTTIAGTNAQRTFTAEIRLSKPQHFNFSETKKLERIVTTTYSVTLNVRSTYLRIP